MIITYIFIVSNLTKSITYLYSWQNYDKWGSRTEQTPRAPRLLAVIIVVLTNSCTFWLHTLLHNTTSVCVNSIVQKMAQHLVITISHINSTFISLVIKTVHDLYFIASNNLLHTCNVID